MPGLGALLHFMLRRSLKANGVDPNSVKYVEVGFPQAADTLRSGQIDAYPAQAPFTARILQSGAGYEVANWLKNTPDGTLTVVYATLRKWAVENKDTVIALRGKPTPTPRRMSMSSTPRSPNTPSCRRRLWPRFHRRTWLST